MAIDFLQAQKKQRYLILILTLVICATLLIVWLGFFRSSASVVPVSLPTAIQPKIEINFGLFKRDLVVVPPVFSAELTTKPSLPALNQKVDLTVNVFGAVNSIPLTYKFDCNNDGEYEKTIENAYGLTQSAVGICEYKDYGTYVAQVSVSGEFKYFEDGAEKTEKKIIQAGSEILVKEPNLDPVISSCDVDVVEGSTLSGFQFDFSVSASDPDGDELVYLWNFGDGTNADVANPAHQYKSSGSFNPFVTIFDSDQGKKKGGEAICHPSSLILLEELKVFEEIPSFNGETGRENPFTPYK